VGTGDFGTGGLGQIPPARLLGKLLGTGLLTLEDRLQPARGVIDQSGGKVHDLAIAKHPGLQGDELSWTQVTAC
jgi:hypothetical protein